MATIDRPRPTRTPTPAAAEQQHIVRERLFLITPEDVLELLSATRATGTLVIDLNQGGVGSIRFTERKKITPPMSHLPTPHVPPDALDE